MYVPWEDVSPFPHKPVPITWMLYKATQYSVMFSIASSYSIASQFTIKGAL